MRVDWWLFPVIMLFRSCKRIGRSYLGAAPESSTVIASGIGLVVV